MRWKHLKSGFARPRQAALLAGCCALSLPLLAKAQTTWTVTQTTDDGQGDVAGSLSWAIDQANNDTGDTINLALSGTSGAGANMIALEGSLPQINQAVTINGNGFEINGERNYRVFFVNDTDTTAPNVTINNLAITGGMGQGGNGGTSGGGGGLGAGGGLFVGAGNVSLANVEFIGSGAIGGNGGAAGRPGNVSLVISGGGGAGLNSAGGAGTTDSGLSGQPTTPAGGGGGGGYSTAGQAGQTTGGSGGGGVGGDGGGYMGGEGGAGGSSSSSGGSGAPNGGGGGGGPAGVGGAGGMYGGGGGTGASSNGTSGAGELGGGGGAGGTGGVGGFGGGGGGGGPISLSNTSGGAGGFDGGSGAVGSSFSGGGTGGGGGGAALGGAVFVQQGATISFTNTSLDAGSLTAGTGGGSGAGDGTAAGSSLFLMGGNATFNVPAGNINVIFGSIAESSPSSLTISGPSGALLLRGDNSYSGGTTMNQGVTVGAESDTALGSGTVTVAGAAQLAAYGADRTLANNISIDRGQTLQISDATAFGDSTPHTLTLSGAISGAGTLDMESAGVLILIGSQTSGDPSFTAGLGTMEFSNNLVELGFNSISSNGSATVVYDNSQIVGGFLSGSGAHTVDGNGASFTGTTIDNGPAFTISGPTTFTNVTNNAALTVTQTLSWSGGSNAASGNLTVNNGATVNTSSFTSSGVMTILGSGVIANHGTDLTLGGGSRTYLGSASSPGGTITLTGNTAIDVNGGLLDNNGAITGGSVTVNYGGEAMGAGTYGTVIVNRGGTFHPGNSPGTATVTDYTFEPGSIFEFDIDDPAGAAGANWSLIDDSGAVSIMASSSPNDQAVIEVDSLTAADQPGAVPSFNPTQSYLFDFIDGGAISGFNADDFAIDSSGFANSLDGGSFSVMQVGNDLDLQFTPAVPEPASLAMGALGTAGLLMRRRRRCR